jgi:archaeal flagellin FlaB
MGKKLKNIFKNKDNGAMGIGALIIFIAMVLVAGIAASVLIQTSTSLQIQVIKTGSQTTETIASGLLLTGIEGYYDSTAGSITLLAFEVRSRAGSPDIDLQTTIIELSDSSYKYILEYGYSLTLSNETGGHIFNTTFYPEDTNATKKFNLIVLQDADGSLSEDNPVVNMGDHVVLAVNTSVFDGGLQNRKNVFGRIIPEEGSAALIDFRTPESYYSDVQESIFRNILELQ